MIRTFWNWRRLAVCGTCALIFSILFAFPSRERADEPYARSRDYDLQNIRTHLWFDLDQRAIRGEATESISTLHDNVSQLKFDSVDLTIENVSVDGKPAKFSTMSQRFDCFARPRRAGGGTTRSFDPL